MKAFGQMPVRGDADRLVFGGSIDALGETIPIRVAQAEPLKRATLLAKSFQVIDRPVCPAVLPGIDAHLLTAAKKGHDPIRRMPIRKILAQSLIEVRVAIDRISP